MSLSTDLFSLEKKPVHLIMLESGAGFFGYPQLPGQGGLF